MQAVRAHRVCQTAAPRIPTSRLCRPESEGRRSTVTRPARSDLPAAMHTSTLPLLGTLGRNTAWAGPAPAMPASRSGVPPSGVDGSSLLREACSLSSSRACSRPCRLAPHSRSAPPTTAIRRPDPAPTAAQRRALEWPGVEGVVGAAAAAASSPGSSLHTTVESTRCRVARPTAGRGEQA